MVFSDFNGFQWLPKKSLPQENNLGTPFLSEDPPKNLVTMYAPHACQRSLGMAPIATKGDVNKIVILLPIFPARIPPNGANIIPINPNIAMKADPSASFKTIIEFVLFCNCGTAFVT